MRARDFLEHAISTALPTLQMKKPAERLGEPDPTYTGTCQIVRTKIEPGGDTKGVTWLEYLDVWVATRLIDPAPADPQHETDLETDLDGTTDAVLDVIKANARNGVRFIQATREIHPDGPHAYRVQVTAKTT